MRFLSTNVRLVAAFPQDDARSLSFRGCATSTSATNLISGENLAVGADGAPQRNRGLNKT
jgi:hypothetical protein